MALRHNVGSSAFVGFSVLFFNFNFTGGLSTDNYLQASTNIFKGGNGDGWASTWETSSNICPNSSTSLTSNKTGIIYQWQEYTDRLGFGNITDNSSYKGTNSISLQLYNIPSSKTGYQFRCVVDGVPGNPITLRFVTYWTGHVSTAWDKGLNWSCGLPPDANTDAIVNAGAPHYPTVYKSTACRSLRVDSSASVIVTFGHTLSINGNN